MTNIHFTYGVASAVIAAAFFPCLPFQWIIVREQFVAVGA